MQTFDVKNINWSAQMVIVKKLLNSYSKEEILYAIDYYKQKGVNMYSIGYLFSAMKDPVDECKAKREVNLWSGNSGERNQRRLAENNQTRSRKKYSFDLYEEPEQDC